MIRARTPDPIKRWARSWLRRTGRPEHPDAPIEDYPAAGRIPWSPGYEAYRLQFVTEILRDHGLLSAFRDGQALPSGFGWRLDERVVEYPWVFSRAGAWGRRVLDAGSTLNVPEILAHPVLREREVIIYDIEHTWRELRQGLSYLLGDLREMVLADRVVDVVVCISTLEHIGFDNTFLYTQQRRYREHRPGDYKQALKEFRRVLRPGGRLLLTVPYGRAITLRWLQQFDARGIQSIISEFTGRLVDASYFKYEPSGWVLSTAADCASCEYFDIHAKHRPDPDFAAAARAVACLEMLKPD